MKELKTEQNKANKTLERDRATCAAFWKVCGSGNFTFYLSFWGLKARPLSSPFYVFKERERNEKCAFIVGPGL
jgi:hypothetical protein